MNKIRKITFLISFLIYTIIESLILYQTWLVAYKPYPPGYGGTAAVTSLLVAAGFLISGIVLSVPKQIRDIGVAVLISSGIVFLIGCTLLEMYPLKF